MQLSMQLSSPVNKNSKGEKHARVAAEEKCGEIDQEVVHGGGDRASTVSVMFYFFLKKSQIWKKFEIFFLELGDGHTPSFIFVSIPF